MNIYWHLLGWLITIHNWMATVMSSLFISDLLFCPHPQSFVSYSDSTYFTKVFLVPWHSIPSSVQAVGTNPENVSPDGSKSEFVKCSPNQTNREKRSCLAQSCQMNLKDTEQASQSLALIPRLPSSRIGKVSESGINWRGNIPSKMMWMRMRKTIHPVTSMQLWLH